MASSRTRQRRLRRSPLAEMTGHLTLFPICENSDRTGRRCIYGAIPPLVENHEGRLFLTMQVLIGDDGAAKIETVTLADEDESIKAGITKVAVLNWTSGAMLNLIIKRLLNNESILKKFCIDREAILRSVDEQQSIFYRFFPEQVEQGSKRRNTLDWILSRCADATDNTAPREVIHLLNSAREEEIARLELGGAVTDGDRLFDRSVFKPALQKVSEARLIQTVYAEYPDLKPQIAALEKQKTEQTIESLANIWRMPNAAAQHIAKRLGEVGFFQIRGARERPTFWVPFLYRDALSMSQGLADE